MTDGRGHIVVTGSVSLYVTSMHHTWSVGNIQVWMKKGPDGWPTADTTVYSWKRVAGSDGVAVFNQLFPGDYFLYAKGYDAIFGADVFGYGQVTLNSTTIENNESYLTLYVSE